MFLYSTEATLQAAHPCPSCTSETIIKLLDRKVISNRLSQWELIQKKLPEMIPQAKTKKRCGDVWGNACWTLIYYKYRQPGGWGDEYWRVRFIGNSTVTAACKQVKTGFKLDTEDIKVRSDLLENRAEVRGHLKEQLQDGGVDLSAANFSKELLKIMVEKQLPVMKKLPAPGYTPPRHQKITRNVKKSKKKIFTTGVD